MRQSNKILIFSFSKIRFVVGKFAMQQAVD